MTNPESPQLRRLSQAQLGIWLAHMLGANKTLYNIGEAIEILGPVDAACFETALRQVIATSDALNLKFVETPDGPRQFLAPDPAWKLPLVDFSGESAPDAAALAWMHSRMDQIVDLAHDPLYDFALLRLRADRHVWYTRYHHLCADGFSAALIARRVAAAYSGLMLPPAAGSGGTGSPAESVRSWFDLLEQELAYDKSAQFVRDREFWRARLAEHPERVTLARRPPSSPDAFARCTADIPAAQTRQLIFLAESCKASYAHVLLAAVAIYLRRLTGAPAFALGMPLTTRTSPDRQHTVGMVSTVLPLCLEVDPTRDLAAVVQDVKRRALEAQLHQRYRLEYLRRDLGMEAAQPDFFGPAVNICSFDYRITFAGWPIRARNIGHWRVDDLEINVYDRGDGSDWTVEFCANPKLYAAAELDAHLQRFLGLIRALVSAGPGTPIHRLSLLGADELLTLRALFNEPPQHFPQSECLHSAFEEQVRRSPAAVALRLGPAALTYAELNSRANRLAHFLRGRGVGPDTLVALCMERSFEMLIAVLGVLKAGGAYVPIDPGYPASRVRYMLEDSGAAIIVTQQALAAELPASERLCVAVDAEQTQRVLADCPQTNPDPARIGLGPQHLAYVIYTSGSTGEPKGVMVEHRNVSRLFEATRAEFAFDGRDVWTLFHSYAFDFSVWEIWGALLHGCTLVIVPQQVSRSTGEFHSLLRREGVTVLNQTPSAFLHLIQEDQVRERLDSLRVVIFGGEALDLAALAPWVSRYGDERPQLVNMYGITETTVHVTYRRLRRQDVFQGSGASLIGRPLRDLSLWLMRDASQQIPAGVPGEMYVGGAGVARGYLKRPELTAQRFIPNPFVPGERLYRTGDLACYRADGELEYLGRIDSQVKIRGFRIETGEIEAQLRKHARVRDALVTVYQRGERRQLLGYVVANAEENAVADSGQTGHWQELYDSVYGAGERRAGDFDIVGWNSSYTGQPLPAAEMRQWVEETVSKLRDLAPRRVLEIGCGTGLLLTRLAPSCESYIGLDFSAAVLAQLGQYVAGRADLSQVVLRQGRADDLAFAADQSVDLVIINSVAQYFPGVNYLLDVLAGAVRVTRDGGHVFVGDVRNFQLLDAYHASVQLHRAPQDLSVEELRGRVDAARAQEEELLVAPALFAELGHRWPRVGRIELSPKLAAYDNELSRFRYDVVLGVGARQAVAAPHRWLSWDREGGWRVALRAELAAGVRAGIGLRGIADARNVAALAAARVLNDRTDRLLHASDVSSFAHTCAGEEPGGLVAFARELGVEIHWQGFGPEGYEAIFGAEWQQPAEPAADLPRSAYQRFANEPAVRGDATIERELKAMLRESLPEYMVPHWISVLRAWPLTANGKLDRRALPLPHGRREDAGEYVAPRTTMERSLAQIWSELLEIDRVGAHDNFFDLGGDSLLAVRVFARIRDAFGKNLPLATLFSAPTIAQLAPALERYADDRPWTSLRAITPAGSGTPLFLVPGIGGNAVGYYELARLLGPGQPVYGLESRGLDGLQKPLTRIPDIAARFVADMRSVQPRGPYLLGGACVGGVVAYEIAQQLIAAGEQVRLLAMFDSWPPSANRAAIIPKYAPPFLAVPLALAQGVRRLPAKLLRMPARKWLGHLRGRLTSAREVAARRDIYQADTAGFYTDLISRSNYWAVLKYFPKPYPGEIALFVASARPTSLDAAALWRRFAQGGCRVQRSGARDSGAMLGSPYVEPLAGALQREIARAAGERAAQGPVAATGVSHA
ncbi:MAG: amino acid adenylation domain-containing protein [Proteobacteria bacterium]|nr:amino acid adenylation domain-containing protein [Pseudomonadota bacterium]